MAPNKIPVFKYPLPLMGGNTNISLDTGFNFKSKGNLIMETTKHNETVEGGREVKRVKRGKSNCRFHSVSILQNLRRFVSKPKGEEQGREAAS